MSYSSQPNLFSRSDNTAVETLDYKGAGRDFINPTINFHFPLPTPGYGAAIFNLVTSRVMTALGLLSAAQMPIPPSTNPEPPHDRQLDEEKDRGLHEEDFRTLPVEELEHHPPDKLTTPQVYVSTMLRSGLGLACWRPRPSSGTQGVTPGDVGTYTAEGGFKKMFNLWDDDAAIRDTARELRIHSYTTPERNIKFDENEFHRGDTVMHGATSEMKEAYSDSFEFQCRGQQGAVLALTSAADLEELDGHALLREHVCQHAELVFRHANQIRRIGDEESLYIITGCIKSDTYALAAFQEYMEPPDHVLKLVRRIEDPTRVGPCSKPQPPYTWTRRGAAQTRTGMSDEPEVKDQSLFLRGFKLDFSLAFRRRMVTTSGSEDGHRNGGQGSSHGSTGHDDVFPHRNNRDSGSRFGGGGQNGQGRGGDGGPDPSPSNDVNPSADSSDNSDGEATFQLEHFPANVRANTCHPCDTITQYLLKATSADFALSHDDDWRFLVIDESNRAPKESPAAKEHLTVVIRHGVAYLATEDPEVLPVLECESEPTSRSTTDSEDEIGIGDSPRTENNFVLLPSQTGHQSNSIAEEPPTPADPTAEKAGTKLKRRKVARSGLNEGSKPWKCGHDYEHAFPKEKVDPWVELLNPRLVKEAARSDGWKNSINTVLIFAGLFSAVVTSFLIESMNLQRKDPLEATLASFIENLNANTGVYTVPVPDGFSRSPDLYTRVNILWFLSLFLSLATALLGMLTLQWLNEYDKHYDADLEPRVKFSLHHMQREALDRWHVPQIIAFIPLILQFSLLSFLLGLTEFLWLSSRNAGMWALVASTVLGLLLILTTTLPGLQDIWLLLPRKGTKPRSPCPYKSPQASAFQLVASKTVETVLHWLGKGSDSRVGDPASASDNPRKKWSDSIQNGRSLLRSRWNDSWVESAVGWLHRRDYDYMSTLETKPTTPPRQLQERPSPLYDAVQGLLHEKQLSSETGLDVDAVDRCIDRLLEATDESSHDGALYASLLNRLSQTNSPGLGLPFGIETDDPSVLKDDAALRLFARRVGGLDSLPKDLERRAAEISVRLTRWLYADQARPLSPPSANEAHPSQEQPIEWIVRRLEKGSFEPDYVSNIQVQVRQIVIDFFTRLRGMECTPKSMNSTMDNNMHTVRFLSSAARILTYHGDHTICDDILKLIKGSSGSFAYPPQAALIFCQAVISKTMEMTPPLHRLVVALHRYEQAGGRLRQPLLASPDHTWEDFISRANALGVALDGDSQRANGCSLSARRGRPDAPLRRVALLVTFPIVCRVLSASLIH